ncbi:MAG: hypothetical protein K9M80_03305 [Candidatus Marinimicrobia bacterium]|nr:hypothetical protein [Candidatus Neomarinimicrobiota bacterium]
MKKVLLIIFTILIICTCDNPFIQKKSGNPLDNESPDTYLFLQINSDSLALDDTSYTGTDTIVTKDTLITGLDTTSSQQVLHWWGEDGDGEVIGYYYQWDYQTEPVFTTQESDTFFVPIRQQYDNFNFRVWAVDNDSLRDPVPAKLTFPVRNSFPNISFRNNSNPDAPANNPNATSFTFPTRTFVWDATDPDGNQTIAKILWTLDDTTNWQELKRVKNGVLPNQITLENIEPGYHTFYAKAVDVAGAKSETIMFPDTTDDQVPNNWYVKEPVGDILLVDDYAKEQSSKEVQSFYTNLLQSKKIEIDTFSIWEIGNYKFNVANTLPYTMADIKGYLNYFKTVIWFSKIANNHLSEAGLGLTKYIKENGNLLIFNGSQQMPDTTWTFTDIDSVYSMNGDGELINKGVKINAHFGDEALNEKYTLELGEWIFWQVIALQPSDNRYIKKLYTMESSDSVEVPYVGEPCVAVHYEPDFIEGESIYFSLSLDICNGKNNVEDLIDYIINEEFED